MASDKIVVRDDTILIDFHLIFKAIREEKGDWKKVEQELQEYFESVNES